MTLRPALCRNRNNASFTIDQKTGKLTVVGHTSGGGQTPRNFGITPDGRYLVAANHGSNDVAVLEIDTATGKLTPTGSNIKVPHCICERFVK